MTNRHQITYKYSCKLHFVDSREVKNIDLPENVSADEFAQIISKQNLYDVTYISLMRTKCVYDLRAKTNHNFVGKNKQLDIYVDDSVKTDRDIRNMLGRKHNYVYGIPITNTNLPHVLTRVVTYTKHGVVYGTSREESWQESHVTVISPNPKHDIIMNRSLKQIWPRNTGALPQVVQEFFIKRQKD